MSELLEGFLQDQVASLQAYMRKLEAEVERLRHQNNNVDVTLGQQFIEVDRLREENARLALESVEVAAKNRLLEAEVRRLKGSAWASMCSMLQRARNELRAERDALRQPCTHEPPGSDPSCAWCLVRSQMVSMVDTETARGAIAQWFDAAVQAVREGQG